MWVAAAAPRERGADESSVRRFEVAEEGRAAKMAPAAPPPPQAISAEAAK